MVAPSGLSLARNASPVGSVNPAGPSPPNAFCCASEVTLRLLELAKPPIMAFPALSTAIALFGAGIYSGDQLPAAGSGIGAAVGFSVEFGISPIAAEDVIKLGCAAAGMPGITVDLRDLDGRPKIHKKASAIAAGIEEEIGGGIIVIFGQDTVGQGLQSGAVAVRPANYERQFCCGRSVIFDR